jgi:hypothetical protein
MTATTIQYFPSLRDYCKKGSISRNSKRINIANFLYEWKREDDPYDYFSSSISSSGGYYKLNYTLNYKIITYLLLNHQQLFLNHFTMYEFLDFMRRGNIFYKESSYINGLKEYMEKNKIDVNLFIKEQFKNIQILSNVLMKKIPKCNAVVDIPRYGKRKRQDKKGSLVLYRGFNYPRYNTMLQNIVKDKVITTQTFLSTSIQKIIAIKYAFNYDKNVDKLIVWKIIIDEDMFDVFYYAFLSEPFNIYDDLRTLLANHNIECELLLNMGALLKCINISVITDFQGHYMTGYNIPAKQYTEYTFQFLGWDIEYIDRVNSNMIRYIGYLK